MKIMSMQKLALSTVASSFGEMKSNSDLAIKVEDGHEVRLSRMEETTVYAVTERLDALEKCAMDLPTSHLLAGSLVVKLPDALLKKLSWWHFNYRKEDEDLLFVILGFNDKDGAVITRENYFVSVQKKVSHEYFTDSKYLSLDGQPFLNGNKFDEAAIGFEEETTVTAGSNLVQEDSPTQTQQPIYQQQPVYQQQQQPQQPIYQQPMFATAEQYHQFIQQMAQQQQYPQQDGFVGAVPFNQQFGVQPQSAMQQQHVEPVPPVNEAHQNWEPKFVEGVEQSNFNQQPNMDSPTEQAPVDEPVTTTQVEEPELQHVATPAIQTTTVLDNVADEEVEV